MPDLPSGTVTFLFTDIEGSTALWERDQVAMAEAVDRHLVLLRAAIEAHGGALFKIVGDAVQAAFPNSPSAVTAAIAAQRALQAEQWPDPPGSLHARMALHAGEAVPRDGDYLAAPLNRLARLLAAGHGTQILLTEVVERLVTSTLPHDVSLRPLGTHRLRDLMEPEEVFQVVVSGLPDQFPPLQSLPRHPTNLSTPPTALIGREVEVAAILSMLDAGVRLVTLTGPGGTGKTRLALEVVAEALDRYPEGVWIVDLSSLIDPDLVIPTIATTLGVREFVGQPLLQTLSGFLTSKRVLLLLDNCEQVLAAAADVTTLLAASSGLSILATSREPLHVRSEREFPLLPLALPAAGRLPPLDELASSPAVALFLERASATQPEFVLTTGNAVAVADICRRLDGLPLAIELAAARIKVLPPAALLARLERRLPLLTGGGRDLPMRQRTMRDAIAWSYDLLGPEEQVLFRRLAVCAGGFTFAAAEAMADPKRVSPVLDGVVALVEQSLLRQVPGIDDEPRYQMLETVREFGFERLIAASETDEVRQRHAEHFLKLTDRLAHGIQILMDLESITRVAPEQDNVRLALAWFDDHGEIDALLGLSSLLYGLWLAYGQYREGLRWLERALERSSHTASPSRVQALVATGMLAIFQGDYARAATFSAEGVALARELGDPLLIGQALTIAGFLAYRQGEYGRAEVLLDEGYARLSQLGDSVPAARPDSGTALIILGSIDIVQAKFERATKRETAALDLFQRVGNDWGIGEAQAALGAIYYLTENYGRAAAHYTESLGRAQRSNNPIMAVSSLLGLAGVATATAQPEKGAHLLGAAEGILSSLGAPIYPRDQPVRERVLAAVTAALGLERLAGAREAGRILTREAAIAEAQTIADPVISFS